MNEKSQDQTESLKDYLVEKNKNFISDTVAAFKEPIQASKDIFESMRPQKLMKSFGTMIGVVPILTGIDNKINEIGETFKNQIITQNKKKNIVFLPGDKEKKTIVILQEDQKDKKNTNKKQDKKGLFLQEAQKDKEIALQIENNKFLEEIANKEGVTDKKSKKNANILKTLFGSLMGGGALAGGAAKGLKNFAKIAVKGLGKIALPIALLMGAKDFADGFGNAMEITGRDDFSAKLQAGLSSAISGLTFGLLDAKIISKYMDSFQERLFGLITDPIGTIKELASKYFTIDTFSNILNTLTLGLLPKDSIERGMVSFKTHVIKLFTDPIGTIKELASKYFTIDTFSNILNTLTFGLLPKDFLENGISSFKKFLKNFFISPFMEIKSKFENLDISGYIENMIEPLILLKNSIFSGDIFKPLTDWFDDFDLIEMMGIGPLLTKVEKFKESIKNLLLDPKKYIMSSFGFGKEDEKKIIRKRNNENISSRKDSKQYLRSTTDNIRETSLLKNISRKNKQPNEMNTQVITNNNTNNNIIRDDMSTQTPDTEYGLYAY